MKWLRKNVTPSSLLVDWRRCKLPTACFKTVQITTRKRHRCTKTNLSRWISRPLQWKHSLNRWRTSWSSLSPRSLTCGTWTSYCRWVKSDTRIRLQMRLASSTRKPRCSMELKMCWRRKMSRWIKWLASWSRAQTWWTRMSWRRITSAIDYSKRKRKSKSSP